MARAVPNSSVLGGRLVQRPQVGRRSWSIRDPALTEPLVPDQVGARAPAGGSARLRSNRSRRNVKSSSASGVGLSLYQSRSSSVNRTLGLRGEQGGVLGVIVDLPGCGRGAEGDATLARPPARVARRDAGAPGGPPPWVCSGRRERHRRAPTSGRPPPRRSATPRDTVGLAAAAVSATPPALAASIDANRFGVMAGTTLGNRKSAVPGSGRRTGPVQDGFAGRSSRQGSTTVRRGPGVPLRQSVQHQPAGRPAASRTPGWRSWSGPGLTSDAGVDVVEAHQRARRAEPAARAPRARPSRRWPSGRWHRRPRRGGAAAASA